MNWNIDSHRIAHGLFNFSFIWMICALFLLGSLFAVDEANAGEISVYDGSSLHRALREANPGDDIVLYPGDYQGIKTESPDKRWHYFYSHRSGSANAPITLRSYSQNDMQVLYGNSVNSSGYILYLTGNHWKIENLKFHTGQKGIMLDSASHNVLDNIAVYNVRDEGVHFRQSSTNNVLSNCHIYDTGRLKPGFGEGVYVGTHEGDRLGDNSDANRIGGCEFGPGVTAEAIDIKAGTVQTIVEHNSIAGGGITGENFADSFIDVKGDKVIIRYNTMHWQGNGFMDHGIHILKRDHQSSNIYQNSVTLGEGMPLLKIGQGTVHALNNQLNYRGRLASQYSSGNIDDRLDENLPAVYSYTGFQDNISVDPINPVDPVDPVNPVNPVGPIDPVDSIPETCLRIERGRKTEMNANTFNCIDLPMEAKGRLVQVWDSNENSSCNFRGELVAVSTSSVTTLTVNANYAGTRGLAGHRLLVEPSNGCSYLIVRIL